MPKAAVQIYDLQMRRVAMLENAFTVGYETPFNGLWTASFSLPASDPKNAECKPLYFVELYEGDERLDLFRIMPNTARRSSDGATITYDCEHVLATLIDDVLFQYHTIGNLGVYTEDVLSYVLSKQVTTRWQLGNVQFDRQFEYNWENETLLGAVISVPKPFVEEYQWTWDTTSYPWTLNLVQPSQVMEAHIRYGVNMQGIERQVDPTNICTRLYGLGWGEGINQLNFAEINNGKPYVEDATAQQAYGVISRIFVDQRFTSAETLKARCDALLEEMKTPLISYTVQATELFKLTGLQMHKFKTGKVVRVQDQELGIDIKHRVVNVRKGDIFGAPGEVEIEIANRTQDIAFSIADLANRQRIQETYAQGATNYDSHNFADNCDPKHPAVLRFWIPEETVRINKVMLSFRTEAFRGYSKAIDAAPATTSGPSSMTSSGPSTKTTTGPSTRITAGASTKVTTAAGGGVVNTDTEVQIFVPGLSSDSTASSGGHNHGIANGTQLALAGGGAVTWAAADSHSHQLYNHAHKINLQAHAHNMEHTHDIDHTHNMDHTHNIDHTHIIPSHTHDIEFGIYEGPSPNAVVVKVDGNVMNGLGTSADEFDIIPYLSKGSDGKINRGTFHEITIAPVNSLGRVVASVFTQIFASSRGGGNY